MGELIFSLLNIYFQYMKGKISHMENFVESVSGSEDLLFLITSREQELDVINDAVFYSSKDERNILGGFGWNYATMRFDLWQSRN